MSQVLSVEIEASKDREFRKSEPVDRIESGIHRFDRLLDKRSLGDTKDSF